jgi:hypothetical protein
MPAAEYTAPGTFSGFRKTLPSAPTWGHPGNVGLTIQELPDHMKLTLSGALAGVAAFIAGIACAETLAPHEKDGLWESSMTMMGRPYTTQSCVSEESQAKMSMFSSQMRQRNCSSSAITHNMDGSWSSTSTCKFGPGAVRTTHAHITGDFNAKYTMEIFAGDSNRPETTMTMTWMGPCKPGMKGGDVIMANGMKMNVLDGTMSGVPPH